MSPPLVELVCAGCGWTAPAGELPPFRCPRAAAGDDTDHVFTRRLDPGAAAAADWRAVFLDPEPNPFLRYRRLSLAYQAARLRGMSDEGYVRLVHDLDAAVARVDGRGFRETPFAPADGLARRLGLPRPESLWIKDETGNVSGSHKGRHLAGVLIWLELAARWSAAPPRQAVLATSSCGNAALAAAVLARAAGRSLEVFVPPEADPAVLERLRRLGARAVPCPRGGKTPPGDPCYHRFRDAVSSGRVPFTCQGGDDGLILDGGETLAYEMVSALVRLGRRLDRVFVQVGGGALASAVIQGFAEARALGLADELPRLIAVQTRAVSPLARAYERLVARLLRRTGGDAGAPASDPATGPAGLAARAAELRRQVSGGILDEELRWAARHRSLFMEPWGEVPRSLATGILDDETYDWLAVVRGLVESGGFPLRVSEESLGRAHALARTETAIPVDATGSAGLAGCMDLLEAGELAGGESLAVLFTGHER